MGMIGRYEQITKLGNENAGTCFWCYAVRGGQEYFIKEFPEPKHPVSDSEATPKQVARKLAKCEAFEKEKTRIYQAVNNSSDGNAVRVTDFFRVGAKYYMAMPRVKAIDMEIEEIAKLPEHVKLRICTVIAHAIAQLHSAHFVHSDIKHSNVMFVHSRTRKLTAKLIDYDAGFFEDTPPRCSEEVKGDQVYYSPEAIVVMYGGEAKLTCKLDVFALGVLFHQYYTGTLPQFDLEQYDSVGKAVAAGGRIKVSSDMPEDIHHLICRMLAADPDERPTAQEVFYSLRKAVELTYIVSHEIEGTMRDVFFYKQSTGNYGDRKITVKNGSLNRKSYIGYKFDKMEPWIVEGETVDDGTVIAMKYIKDETQQKTVSYTVQHKVDGMIVDTSVHTKHIWINAPNELPIEVGSLTPKDYVGCKYDAIDTAKQEGDLISSGTVVTLKYVTIISESDPVASDNDFTGDAPARPGWWDMGDL